MCVKLRFLLVMFTGFILVYTPWIIRNLKTLNMIRTVVVRPSLGKPFGPVAAPTEKRGQSLGTVTATSPTAARCVAAGGMGSLGAPKRFASMHPSTHALADFPFGGRWLDCVVQPCATVAPQRCHSIA